MCFSTGNYTEEVIKASIAEEDIKCYKFLNDDLTSPFRGGDSWKVGEIRKELRFEEETDDSNLDYGFHSCIDLECCKEYRGENEEYGPIYEFIIPKGSLYFENITQYISNQIYLASDKPVEPGVEYDDDYEVEYDDVENEE